MKIKAFAHAATLILTLTASAAFAEDLKGEWLRSDGAARIRMESCGGSICGSVSWVRDAKRTKDVGLKVFYDMVQSDANTWSGHAFNPEDGKTYTGKIIRSGDAMTTKGCVMGGLICKSVSWTRYRG